MFRSGTGSGSNDRGGTYDPVFVSPASNGVPLRLPLFTWVGPALHFDFTLTIIDNSYCMPQCFGCMAISCSLIQRTIDHMLKGKSCLDFDSFHKKPVLIARNSRSACETIVSISCSTAWTDELQVVKSLMTIASIFGQPRITTYLAIYHQWAEACARETFFLPEGFLVAFLTGLFQSGFHINNPDVT